MLDKKYEMILQWIGTGFSRDSGMFIIISLKNVYVIIFVSCFISEF